MNASNTLHITTGDTDGIGLEITQKALAKVKLPKSLSVKVWISKAQSYPNAPKRVEIIRSEKSPAHWVIEASKEIIKTGGCLVTGPLSKELIKQSGINCIGHTEILSKVTGAKDLKMFFVGEKFNVLLASGHMPLQKVETYLKSNMDLALHRALEAKSLLGKRDNRPIAVVGLNPHASEGGLIGNFDIALSKKLLAPAYKYNFFGPLVPDVAFQKNHWKKYSLYFCPYHDQGLIPFKLIHGQDSGIHVTVGLPFLRVSVDHGTAKDIFGKNRANPGSMIQALKFAIKNS